MDKLALLFDLQREQQLRILGSSSVEDEAERIRIGSELCAGIHEEVSEYMRHLGYKSLLPDQRTASDRRSGRILELADMMKYVLSLAHLDGVTNEELIEAFTMKTMMTYARFDSEVTQSHIAGFDIDGVIADLDGAGYDWTWDEETKRSFFNSGGATRCKPFPLAVDLLRRLKAAGWGIVLVTARKRLDHPRLEAETHQWLRERDIPYDRLIFAYDKAQAIVDSRLPLRFFVEDSPKHALDVASLGFPVYYLGPVPVQHQSGRIVPRNQPSLLRTVVTEWLNEDFDSSCYQ